MSDVLSGAANSLLVDYIGDTKCFPLAYNLTVSVSDYETQHVNKETAINNALEFAKLLKSMAPAATTAEIKWYQDRTQIINLREKGENSLEEEILATLANEIYAGIKRASFDLEAVDAVNLSTVDFIPSLSLVSLGVTHASDLGTSLMHKSASTLQNLEIAIDNANALIYDINGNAVVYPNLEH
ncbi:hypothetical protein GGH92_002883, partial [Coemansia sp. RSA 2673]